MSPVSLPNIRFPENHLIRVCVCVHACFQEGGVSYLFRMHLNGGGVLTATQAAITFDPCTELSPTSISLCIWPLTLTLYKKIIIIISEIALTTLLKFVFMNNFEIKRHLGYIHFCIQCTST